MCVTNVPEKFLTTTWSPQKDLDAIHVHIATSLHHVQDLQDPSPQNKVISMKIFDNIKYKTLFQQLSEKRVFLLNCKVNSKKK